MAVMVRTRAKNSTMAKNSSCQSCAYFRGKHGDLSSCRHYEVADGLVIEATYERPYGICKRYHPMQSTAIRHVEMEDVGIG